DDEGGSAEAEASESVEVTDVAPIIDVTKEAVAVGGVPASDPDVTEPGGTVTYEVTITNSSVSADPVTIASLQDGFDGVARPPADIGTCAALVGTTSAPGATVECTYDAAVTGSAGDVLDNTVTVGVWDDDGPTGEETPADATDSASESVDVVSS